MGISLDAANALEAAIDKKIEAAASRETRANGTVTRVDADGQAYVMLDGSEVETPVTSTTAAVHEGERVVANVSDGELTVDGNMSAPATDDTAAHKAMDVADSALDSAAQAASAAASAMENAAIAEQAAQDAQDALQSVVTGATTVEKAVSVMQTALEAVIDYDPDEDEVTEYFWHDANGAHVLGDTSGYRNDIDSTGMTIVEVSSEDEVASFGADGWQVGLDDESHMVGDYHSLQLVDKEGDAYFHISDLRNHDGTAEISEEFIANGTTSNFYTTFDIYDSNCTVTVDDVEVTSGITIMPGVVKFTSPPSDGSVVELDYLTASPRTKAYTLGVRRANRKIGAMSVGEGLWPTASGAYSHAEGYATTASGTYSHSEGSGTTASGSSGHSEGAATQATGTYSHAEGQVTKARSLCSHAEGQGSEANGKNSHAQNLSTIASSNNQTALGRYNIEDANDTYAVIIGNGEYLLNSNAVAIDWLGNAELWHPEIVRGIAPASDIYGGGGALKLVDKNGVQIGFVQPVQYADGTEAMQLGVGNSDSSDWNTLTIGYDGNDNKYVNISGRSEWRNALGASSGVWPVSVGGTGTANFAAIVSDHADSNVKVPTSTYKSIASVQLAAGGTYILVGGVSFADNSTGRRFIAMYTSETTPANAYLRATGVAVAAASGGQTRLHTSWISAPGQNNATMHLLGWQNSGGDLNATGYLRAIRIA